MDGCENSGEVCGTECVGGLVGLAGDSGYFSCVRNSVNRGEVNGTSCTGGLVGLLQNCEVQNSYNRGEVTGTDKVGGLVGQNGYSTDYIGNVYNAYNAAPVTGSTNYSAKIGYTVSGSGSETCYYDSDVYGDNAEDGDFTTEEMKSRASGVPYTLLDNYIAAHPYEADGWALWNIGGVTNDGYPYLTSEKAKYTPDYGTDLVLPERG